MIMLFNWIHLDNEQIYADSKQFESMHFEYNYKKNI